MIMLSCGRCHSELRVPLERAGKRTRCPACNRSQLIPDIETDDYMPELLEAWRIRAAFREVEVYGLTPSPRPRSAVSQPRFRIVVDDSQQCPA
jgi:DNA-directed RNA polymerase subunit RPC12/RpoP